MANWTSTALNTSNPALKLNPTAIDPNNPLAKTQAGTVNASDPASQMTAATWNPDSNSLVEDRMGGLLSKDSPYMQAARTSGLQYANSRGLLNSSMGAEASEAAAIKAALPIASQDAQTFTSAGMTNAAAENNARQFNAATFNQRDLTNAGYLNDASKFNADTFNQRDLTNAGYANDASKFNAGNQVNLELNNNAMANDAGKFNASEANTSERLATELASRERTSADSLASSENIANANRDAAAITAQAAREAQVLSTSGSIIAGSFDTHNAYVKTIYADPDLDMATKQLLEYNSAVGTRDAITLTSSVFNLPNLDAILGGFGTPATAPVAA